MYGKSNMETYITIYKIRYDQTALRNYGGLYGTNAYKSLGKKQKKLAWYLAYRVLSIRGK